MVRFLLVTLTFSYFFCSSPGKIQPGDGELKKQKKQRSVKSIKVLRLQRGRTSGSSSVKVLDFHSLADSVIVNRKYNIFNPSIRFHLVLLLR